MLEELRAYRDAGGTTLVDLTLDGVGRDPLWLQRLAEQSGLHLVMGGGWYRDRLLPGETLIDRRSVDSLAEELVREATVGVGETGVRTGILGEIGTDKPWVTPSRGARLPRRRPGVAPDRPRDHDPRRPVRRRRRAARRSSRRRAWTRGGS